MSRLVQQNKNRNRFQKLIVTLTCIASVSLICIIVMNMLLMSRSLMNQTSELGKNRIGNIAQDLENTIENNKYMLSNMAADVEKLYNEGLSFHNLKAYFMEQSERQQKLSKGICLNVFCVQGSEYIVPGLYAVDQDFRLSNRAWYARSMKLKAGEYYITSPYEDYLSGDLCYTITTRLSDGMTILGMDFSMSVIQNSILEMKSDQTGDAWIIDEDGLVVGSSREKMIRKNFIELFPGQKQALAIIFDEENTNENMDMSNSIREGDITYFYSKLDNGWYLIYGVNTTALYRDRFSWIFQNSILNLVIVLALILLLCYAYRSNSRAQKAVLAKEKFLSGLSDELRSPLQSIKQNSVVEIGSTVNHAERMKYIQESVGQLSEMLDNLFSYSGLYHIEQEKKELKSKGKKKDNLGNRPYILTRVGVTIVLFVTMIVAIAVNIYIASSLGQTRMYKEAENYAADVHSWMQVQENTLSQMVYTLEDDENLQKSQEELCKFLRSTANRYEDISVAYLAGDNQDWKVLFSDDSGMGHDIIVQAYPWYLDAINNRGSIIISDPWYDIENQVYCITLSKTVNASSGEILGVLAVDFYLERLTDVLVKNYTEDSYAFMTNRNGIIINHPDEKLELSSTNSVNVSNSDYKVLNEKRNTVRYIKDYDGSFRAYVSLQDNESGFMIVVVKNWWSVYGNSVICSIVFILLFGLCLFAINYLVYRLVCWQQAMDKQLRDAVKAANQATEAKSKFLAQMSHEIRTPINAVLGMNEMILRESNNESINEYATNIGSAGNTLLTLINSILDFSKIEDGHMEIIPVDYQTSSLVQDLYSMIIDRAEKKNLLFHMEIDEKLPKGMRGDDVRVRQVIMNLLTNAVKYTQEGSVTLSMTLLDMTDEDVVIKVAVKDTGIGIREEDREKLFQSFQRLDQEKNRNIEGTGLGISIVSSLLSMMGSSLQVDSIYGQGSTFYFELHQKLVDGTPIGLWNKDKKKTTREEKQWLYAPTANVLVVDDNEMNLKVIRGLLKRSQCNLTLCSSGNDAIETVRKQQFDVILMDHMMPTPDGIETMHMMREEQLLPEETVVIVLTANAISGAREKYLSVGFDYYLSKPIQAEELENTLFRYLPDEKCEMVDKKQNLSETSEKEQVSEVGQALGTTEILQEEKETEKEDSLMSQLESIVDTKVGLQYCMSSEEFYLEMLQEFMNGDKQAILEECFATENWEQYQITVHALKSTALTIGGVKLSEEAKTLETACKEKKISYIQENHATLMEHYSEFLSKLANILV